MKNAIELLFPKYVWQTFLFNLRCCGCYSLCSLFPFPISAFIFHTCSRRCCTIFFKTCRQQIVWMCWGKIFKSFWRNRIKFGRIKFSLSAQTYSGNSMRPEFQLRSNTTPKPPTSTVPLTITNIMEPIIITVCMTSVQTTALRPPFTKREK